MTELAEAFRAVMRELRAGRGWTQRELAKRSGIANSHIAHVESGVHRPTVELMLRLANAFDITLGDFGERLEACLHNPSVQIDRRKGDDRRRRLVLANKIVARAGVGIASQ